MKLLVQQYGLALPDTVSLHTYSEAAQLDGFQLNSGDRQGTLTGTRLDEVRSFELNGIRFTPGKLSTSKKRDMLEFDGASKAAAAALPLSKRLSLTSHSRTGGRLNSRPPSSRPGRK